MATAMTTGGWQRKIWHKTRGCGNAARPAKLAGHTYV
jgi:hypothetical protein